MHTSREHTGRTATNVRKERTFSSASYLLGILAELEHAAISARIKQAREQAGLAQQELGDLLDPPVGFRAIQTWESVRQDRVPWRRLGQIADATGVTKDWLLRGDEAVLESPTASEELQRLREELAAVREMVQQLLDEQTA